MERILNFTATDTGVTPESIWGGCAGEHLVTRINVNVAASFINQNHYFRLEFLNSVNHRSFTDDLDVADDTVTFLLPQGLMQEGTLKVQLVVYEKFGEKAAKIVKALPFTLSISPAVMADNPVERPFSGLLSAGIEEFLNFVRNMNSMLAGKSAYEIALANGFIGSEQDFLNSLMGERGEQGIQGERGLQGERGPQGERGAPGSYSTPIQIVNSSAGVNLNSYTTNGTYLFNGNIHNSAINFPTAGMNMLLEVFAGQGDSVFQRAFLMTDSPPVRPLVFCRTFFQHTGWTTWNNIATIRQNHAFPNQIVPDPQVNNFETSALGASNLRYQNIFLANSPNVSSDERLKEDIKPVSQDGTQTNAESAFDQKDLLDFINAINIVTYKFKADKENTKRLGVIANQFEEINPELAALLVKEGDDGMLGLQATDLVYPLISAAQALSSNIVSIEQRLNMLEMHAGPAAATLDSFTGQIADNR